LVQTSWKKAAVPSNKIGCGVSIPLSPPVPYLIRQKREERKGQNEDFRTTLPFSLGLITKPFSKKKEEGQQGPATPSLSQDAGGSVFFSTFSSSAEGKGKKEGPAAQEGFYSTCFQSHIQNLPPIRKVKFLFLGGQ